MLIPWTIHDWKTNPAIIDHAETAEMATVIMAVPDWWKLLILLVGGDCY